MAKFNLDDYVDVNSRIKEFYGEFPEGSITTHVVHLEGPRIVIEARVYRTIEEAVSGVYTSGIAHEVEGTGHVNKTSHIENCETSAIGRALANLNYGTDKNRPSRQEMIKVARMDAEHKSMIAFVERFGAGIDDESTIEKDGTEVNVKEYIRENWGEAKDKFLVARELVKIVEAEVGEEFAVPA